MNKYLNYLNDNYFKEINYIYIKQSKTKKKKTDNIVVIWPSTPKKI